MEVERQVLARLRSHSPEATEALGEALGRAVLGRAAVGRAALGEAARGTIDDGLVLALLGELGAGKTCFVRGLGRGLEVEAPVASPTFTLMNTYPGPVPLYHFDAWRTGNEEAYLDDGGDEWLHAGGVAVVEWADKIRPRLPESHLELRLAHRSDQERLLELCAVGSGRAALAAVWGPVARAAAESVAELTLLSEGA